MSPEPPLVRLIPSATDLGETDRGAVVVCGSHGGLYAAAFASRAGVRAVICNDAGIGRDAAGVAGLETLERDGIAAATVSSSSGRIGDPQDMQRHGIISRSNAAAALLGVRPGIACSLAVARLTHAPIGHGVALTAADARIILPAPVPGGRRIILVDSASLVEALHDHGAIIVTGSHGGLVGGDAARALAVDAFAAVFNDAGVGKDEAGVARLAALESRGIRAFTVSADSARIGDARSTFEDGIISFVNPIAGQYGAAPGQRARDVLLSWAGPCYRQ